jgi:hypothetical protein
MANRSIELHDTRIERVERAERTTILWMSAYLHESEGQPGRDRGTGWTLPARLVIENSEFECPLPSSSLWVIDGRISIADRVLENMMPVPFDEHGEIRVHLSGSEGEIFITGNHAYLEPIGPAIYIEDFSPCDER